ncbi:MAG TPA: winged helix-turn-helix domain-containing protein, partial [Ideonella sp.]|nr:winged helix-turn-helix domain-containing protein [Ideonella sp.]
MTLPLAPDPAERPAAAAWPVWQLGRLRFHSGTRQLSDEHGSQSLTLKSAEVLKRLIAGGGEVVSREQLIAEVWQGNSYTGSQALTHTIWQLRRALDAGAESGESAIATVSKSGYRLMLPISPVLPVPDHTVEA